MNDNLNELYHYGVSGQHWNVHQFGNWERHARYANGRPNPETMGKRDAKRGAYDAKRDAAIQVLNKPKDFDFSKRWHAESEFNHILPYLIGSPLTGVIYNAYKRNKSIKGYNERYKDSTKDFNKELSKSTIKRLGLSKEYVDAYSKTMDEALKVYGISKSEGKTIDNNGNLKYAGLSKEDKEKKKEEKAQKKLDKKITNTYKNDITKVYWMKDENGRTQNWEMPAEEADKIMSKEIKKKLNERLDKAKDSEKDAYVKKYNELYNEYINDTKELDKQYKVMMDYYKTRKQDKKSITDKQTNDFKNAQKYELDYLKKYWYMTGN